MTELPVAAWRTSTRSQGNGECVQVAEWRTRSQTNGDCVEVAIVGDPEPAA